MQKQPSRFSSIPIEMPVAVAFASGVCISILAVLALVYAFNSEPARDTALASAQEQTTENPAGLAEKQALAQKQTAENPVLPAPTRVLDTAPQPPNATPRDEVSCENQTWPYIDQRCLTPAPPKERSAATPSATKPASEGNSLSPNFEVRPDAPAAGNRTAIRTVAPASTDGVASASDRVSAPPAPAMTSALPDRPMAVTGETATRPRDVATADSPIAAQAAPAAATQAPESVEPRRQTKRSKISKSREARKSRERVAAEKAGDPNRIVRRWREVEYQDSYGETRRVIYVRPGTLQRDTYFETAR